MPNKQYDDQVFKQAIALIRSGTPTGVIAKVTGVSASTVSMWRYKYINVSDADLPTFTDRYKRINQRKPRTPTVDILY